MSQPVRRTQPWDDFNERAKAQGWPTVCDPHLAFDSEDLSDLLHIWQMARGRRAIPRRADLSPRVLGRHLSDSFLVERVQPRGQVRRYRIAFHGSRAARRTGDMLGKYIDDVIGLEFIESWYRALDLVLAARAPLRFVARFRAFHLEHLRTECLVAPVGDGMGMPNGAMCAMSYTPVAAPTP